MIDLKLETVGGWPSATPFITTNFNRGVTADSATGTHPLAGIRQPEKAFESPWLSQGLWGGVADG